MSLVLEICERCGRDLVLRLNRTAYELHGSLLYVRACLICGYCSYEDGVEVAS